MLVLSNVPLPLDAGLSRGNHLITEAVCDRLKVSPTDLIDIQLIRRSIDARKRADVHFVAKVLVDLSPDAALGIGEEELARRLAKRQVRYEPGTISTWRDRRGNPFMPDEHPKDPREHPPIVVGCGPAGLFCALRLARAGLNPILIERGSEVHERKEKVDEFLHTGILGMQSNVQFGEGGAGTFSDGKLTTNTHDPRCLSVIETFVAAGAPDDIIWQAKPHIGTDRLVDAVANIRAHIESLGGLVLFDTELARIYTEADDEADGFERASAPHIADGFERASSSHIAAVEIRSAVPLKADQFLNALPKLVEKTDVQAEDDELVAIVPCEQLVLAIGHSARDTFEMLLDEGLAMEPKPFSIGVRIEHSQEAINHAQYGESASHPALESADYKLVEHLENGRGVYTFCMCPGGTVVPAASEMDGVVTNGMSDHARNGVNANSAVLVDVRPEDLGSAGPLAGIEFQRRWERLAYALGGGSYRAPAQYVGDFLAGRSSEDSMLIGAPDSVVPSYGRGITWADLRDCLPAFVTDSIKEALPRFARKLEGFDAPGAVMTGVETRSSSPVRILRDESLMASIAGIYPCGEGAGYAGGIMSAAVDGLKVAQAIIDAPVDSL